jgi:hypothetical protein
VDEELCALALALEAVQAPRLPLPPLLRETTGASTPTAERIALFVRSLFVDTIIQVSRAREAVVVTSSSQCRSCQQNEESLSREREVITLTYYV